MSNLTTSYLTAQIERNRLTAQAERGWQADQAAALRARPHLIDIARRQAGRVLILTGERMQGAPRGVPAPAT